jgi:hypothetical protein
VEQLRLDLGPAEKRKVRIPLDSRSREELVTLMAMAIVALHRSEGERRDDQQSIES